MISYTSAPKQIELEVFSTSLLNSDDSVTANNTLQIVQSAILVISKRMLNRNNWKTKSLLIKCIEMI